MANKILSIFHTDWRFVDHILSILANASTFETECDIKFNAARTADMNGDLQESDIIPDSSLQAWRRFLRESERMFAFPVVLRSIKEEAQNLFRALHLAANTFMSVNAAHSVLLQNAAVKYLCIEKRPKRDTPAEHFLSPMGQHGIELKKMFQLIQQRPVPCLQEDPFGTFYRPSALRGSYWKRQENQVLSMRWSCSYVTPDREKRCMSASAVSSRQN